MPVYPVLVNILPSPATVASLILKLLTLRVGALTPALTIQIESLTLEQLEALGEALLDFSTLAGLEAWLEVHL